MIGRLFSTKTRTDERVKKSVFREVAKYDSQTKLGLKVFHLQELSLTSFREFDLLPDPKYLALKTSLLSRDSISKLSPAQMVATVISLGKLGGTNRKEWSILADAIKAHVKKKSLQSKLSESTMGQPLSPSQVGACLYAFSRTHNAWVLKNVDLIYKHVLRNSVQWTPIDMGWYLFFIRQKNLPLQQNPSLALIDQIAYRFNERLAKSTPRNIACVLHGFSMLKVSPGQAINRSCMYLERKLKKLDPKSTTLLFAALAKLKIYKIRFVHQLADHVVGNMDQFTTSQLCTIFHSLAKLAIFHRALVARILEQNFQTMTEIDFALFTYSLGQFRIRNKLVWEPLFERFNQELHILSPQSVSMFVAAVSRVEEQSKQGFDIISNKRVDPVSLGMVNGVWLKRIGKHIKTNRLRFTDRQVLNSLHALVKLGGSVSPLPKWKINLPLTHAVTNQISYIEARI